MSGATRPLLCCIALIAACHTHAVPIGQPVATVQAGQGASQERHHHCSSEEMSLSKFYEAQRKAQTYRSELVRVLKREHAAKQEYATESEHGGADWQGETKTSGSKGGFWCRSGAEGEPSLCHEERSDCEGRQSKESRCTWQKRAACFVYRDLLQDTVETHCAPLLSECDLHRRPFLRQRRDYQVNSICKPTGNTLPATNPPSLESSLEP